MLGIGLRLTEASTLAGNSWWLAARHRLDGVAPAAILSPASGRSMLNGKRSSDGALISRQGGVKYVIGRDGVLQQVAANALAYDYASGHARLKFEGAATNVVPDSSDPAGEVWAGDRIARSLGAADPARGTAASRVTCVATGALACSYIDSTAFTAGTTYTLSRFVRAGTQTLLQLTGATAAFGNAQYANFNLATAGVTVATGCTATIVRLAAGWFRISITVAATTAASAAASGVVAFIPSPDAPRLPDVTLTTWYDEAFPQCETGPVASSYIPTSGADVTRPADVVPLWSTAGQATAWAWRGSVPVVIVGQYLLGGSNTGPSDLILRAKGSTPSQMTLIAGNASGLDSNVNAIPGILGACCGWGASGRTLGVLGSAASDALLKGDFGNVNLGGRMGLQAGQILELDELIAWRLPDRPSVVGCQSQAHVWSV